jgi:hypothetical protein
MEEGTRLHSLIPPGDLGGLDDEQTAMVEKARALVLHHAGPGWTIWHEVGVELKVGDETIFGTADVVGIPPVGSLGEEPFILEFKFGRSPPPMLFLKAQGSLYSAGLLSDVLGAAYDEVDFHAHSLRTGGHYHATVTRAEVEDIVGWVEGVIQGAKEAPELIPHPEACQRCPALAWCPAAAAAAMAVTRRVEANGDLAPERLARELEAASWLSKWVDAKQDQGKEVLKAGGAIPGWKLKTTAGAREITDAVEAWEYVDGLMSQEEYLGCMKVGLGKLEAAWVAKARGAYKIKKDEALARFNQDLAPVIKYGEPRTRLEREEG